MKRNYIGLATSFHDSAMAIVDSAGSVVFAEATERFLQSKRAIGITPDLVHRTGDLIREYCEPGAEIVSAYSWLDRPRRTEAEVLQPHEERWKKLRLLYDGELPAALHMDIADLRHSILASGAVRHFSGHNLDYELARIGWPTRVVQARRSFDHHLTHAAAACFSSPFEEAVCAVVDGYGETGACAFFRYRDGRVSELARSGGNGSLGLFFTAICIACGFGILSGEEWKVMGLAGYGQPDEALIQRFQQMLHVDGLSLMTRFDPEARIGLRELMPKPGESVLAAANVAYAGQHVFCETLYTLLRNLHRLGVSQNLVLAGGCALNSSATGGIVERCGFRNVHVFCAPGDDGNAVGAALLAHRVDHPDHKPAPGPLPPYLGSRLSQQALANVRAFSGAKLTDCIDDAPERAAALLARGKIIGWIQGNAEFGPRALGNRSILADPRSPGIKDEINSRVKFREEFRPLAPSILAEHGPEYFENYQDSPYMERTLKYRDSVKAHVPGVVHVDGTGRLQSVRREWNPLYHRLITEFYRLTGVPLVLNTSFNVMGKPISHSVEDVLAVFYSTGLDAVFLEHLLLEK